MYVDDCADAILLAIDNITNNPQPVNIGSGFEISMKELAHLIATKIGYNGSIRWDVSRPNGQPRRCLNTSLAEELLGFKAQISLNEGIDRTILWFMKNRNKNKN